MKVYKPLEQAPISRNYSIFLAGSIDMGEAENWQDRVIADLRPYDNLDIFNPRRDDWDSSWAQDPTPGTQFHEQVTWELDHIYRSNLVAFYFADNSKSPVSMLELGLCAADLDVAVFCTPKFYRYGNIKMVCDKHNIRVYHDYDSWLRSIQDCIVWLQR